MPNYKSRDDDENIGGSLIGGALDMLNQYEANMDNDEYSENNPTEQYREEQLNLNDNDKSSINGLTKSLIGGEGGTQQGGALNTKNAIQSALNLTPMAFHHFTEVAKHNKDIHGGAIKDIMSAKSPHHLAKMIHRDYDMEGKTGGAFWSSLMKVGKVASKFAPLVIKNKN